MSSPMRSREPLVMDRTYAAFLFDMDGTLIDSLGSSRRCWGQWAARHGVNFESMWREIHGMRQADAMRRWGPAGLDIAAEVDELVAAEMNDCHDVAAIAGAAQVLRTLPLDRWCVVTSAPKRLAYRRLEAAGLPIPVNMIAAEDVEAGKPAPDCFLAAARRLDVAPSDCLVWEDAPAGIAAAEAAGMDVIVVSATHASPLMTRHDVIWTYDDVTLAVSETDPLPLAVAAA